MPLRPMKDVGIRTERDERRRAELEEAHRHWAEVDAHIDDALGSSATIPVIDLEAD